MRYLRFVTANAVGALTWGVAITLIGYFAASNPAVRPVSYVIAGIVIVASIIAGIRAWRADRASTRAASPVTTPTDPTDPTD